MATSDAQADLLFSDCRTVQCVQNEHEILCLILSEDGCRNRPREQHRSPRPDLLLRVDITWSCPFRSEKNWVFNLAVAGMTDPWSMVIFVVST